MKTKSKFWKILIAVLLYSLITHWKDARQGFLDGLKDEFETYTQKSNK